MESYTWYAALLKPTWAPPAWLFGPVWTMLYVVIAISFTFVFYKAYTREIPLIVALPFALNLLFNLLFTPVQFGLKNNELASLVILLILGTLIWALVAVFPYARMVTYANLPYLVWVLFATALQLSITVLNR
jgi:tryptophan-rich sensory protein